MSSSERQRCETLLSLCWTHTSPQGRTPISLISPITAQRRSAYDNDSFHYVTKGAESKQPVGAAFYQWVGCRDHAGLPFFPHSGSWQAQGEYIYLYTHTFQSVLGATKLCVISVDLWKL